MRCPSPFPALIGLVVLSSAAGALRVGSGGLGGLFSYGALGGSIYEQCKNTVDSEGTVCAHGGVLHAENSTASQSCHYCDCEGGWGGIECRLCSNVDVCQPRVTDDGVVVPPIGCSSDHIDPLDEEFEWHGGKTFDCACGGDDPSTQWVCDQSKGYNYQVHVVKSDAGDLTMTVRERAPVPSMDTDPVLFAFVYAQVWDAEFTGCSVLRGPCPEEIQGAPSCVTYKCHTGQVTCPPQGVTKCPGWSTVPPYCDIAPERDKAYYQHNCNPLTLPSSGVPSELVCSSVRDPATGQFQCYLKQEGAFLAALGMRCSSGQCLYSTIKPPAPTPPPDKPTWVNPFPETSAIAGLVASLAATLAAVAFAFGFHSDLKMSGRRANGGGDSGGGVSSTGEVSDGSDEDGAGGASRGSEATRLLHGAGRSRMSAASSTARMQVGRAAAREEGAAFVFEKGAETVHGVREDRSSRSAAPATAWPGSGVARVTGDVERSRVGSSGLGERAPTALTFLDITLAVFTITGKPQMVLRGVSGVVGSRSLLGAGYPRQDTRAAAVGSALSGASGAEPGSLTALMGPSGSGKSSLLDVLSGRRWGGIVGGQVALNGRVVDAGTLRRAVGYVTQDDVLPASNTVFEHLLFHANLRIAPSPGEGPGALARRRHDRVWEVLTALGLDRVAHSVIGGTLVRGISGGEKRRVSIAVELLSSAQVLLLDEPTTGLDSTNAAHVVDILRKVSASGVPVLLSIHQPKPEVLRMLDNLILLSSRGQCIYSGSLAAAHALFDTMGITQPPGGDMTLADVLLDAAIKLPLETVEEMVAEYHLSAASLAVRTVHARSRLHPASAPEFWHPPVGVQLQQLMARSVREFYRHPLSLVVNVGSALVVAVVLGTVFYRTGSDTAGIQSRLGVLFFMLLYLSMMALAALPLWHDSLLLVLREAADHAYGLAAFMVAYLATSVVLLRLLPPVLFAAISYPLIGLHPGSAWAVLAFAGTLTLGNVASTGLSMLIGAVTRSHMAATSLGSAAMMAFMVFGGFLMSKASVPKWCAWISNLSFFNFAYEALAISEFHRSPLQFVFNTPLPDSTLPPLHVTGDAVLREFGFEPANLGHDLLWLAALASATLGLTYLALRLSTMGIRTVLLCSLHARRLAHLHASAIAEMPQREAPAVSAGRGDGWGSLGASQASSSNSLASPRGRVDLHASLVALQRRSADSRSERTAARQPPVISLPSPGLSETDRLALASVFSAHGSGLVLSWSDIQYAFNMPDGERREILQGVSGLAVPALEDGGEVGSGDDERSVLEAQERAEYKQGCLLGVLGPSGAGKTTLLDVLGGRLATGRGRLLQGDIRVSGALVGPHDLHRLVKFVPQEDMLPAASTVREHLLFHARLRMPRQGLACADFESLCEGRVRALMDVLGLAKVADSVIGDQYLRGISGGEKRRVSLAMELVSSRGLLLLDEPTTGLDSTNAASVVTLLHHLTAAGTTVLLSIHQPRSDVLGMLDRMVVLSPRGQMVFSGPMAHAEPFFTSAGYPCPPGVHVADYALSLVMSLSPLEAGRLAARFAASATLAADMAEAATGNEEELLPAQGVSSRRKSTEGYGRVTASVSIEHFSDVETGSHLRAPLCPGEGDSSSLPMPPSRPSLAASKRPLVDRARSRRAWEATAWEQFWALLSRSARQTVRHPVYFLMNAAFAVLVAVVIGSVYRRSGHDTPGIQNRFGAVFFMLAYMSVMSLSSLPLWEDQRVVFVHEYSLGTYSAAAAFATTVVMDFVPLRLLPPLAFVGIAYPMIGLRAGLWHRLSALLDLSVAHLAASATSMLIGAAIDVLATANMVGTVAVLVMVMLGGFLLSLRSMGPVVRVIAALSPIRWACEALLDVEFHGIPKGGFSYSAHAAPGIPPEDVPHVDVSGDEVMNTFGFTPGSLPRNTAMLGLQVAVFVALTYVAVKRLVQRH